MLAEWGLWTVRSKSWKWGLVKCGDSERSSERRAFARDGGRKLWIRVQGVCAAIEAGE